VIAAVMYEEWAETPDQATELAAGGTLRFVPNHDLGGVGPMAGILSPTMHVYVVEDEAGGGKAYSCTEFDALFGAFDDAALDEIKLWNKIVFPVVGRAVRKIGGLDLKSIMTRALTMGDELHSRQTAASSLLALSLAPAIVETSSTEEASLALKVLGESDLSFLPLSMAACKLGSMAAANVPNSTLVTAMARNGTDFGVQVSGLGPQWFCAPAPTIEGIYFPGFGPDDAGFDMGDSAITETNGLGAFALAASPTMSGLVGVSVDQLNKLAGQMREICAGVNSSWSIPQLDSGGPPIGIDIRKVLQSGIAPLIDTATAHRDPGHRIIGAGISRAPMVCFSQALDAWFDRYAPTSLPDHGRAESEGTERA
jgi:hypothetical protein